MSTSVSNLNTSVSNVISSVSQLGGEGHSTIGRSPRMKNLGTLASSQATYDFLYSHKIPSGKFEDIELGDYISITHSQINTSLSSTISEWYIAGLDWFFEYYTSGRSNPLWAHHICLLSKNYLGMGTTYGSTATVVPFKNSNIYGLTKNISTVVQSTLNDYMLDVGRRYSESSVSSNNIYSMVGAGILGYTNPGTETTYKMLIPNSYELTGSYMGASYNEYHNTPGEIPLFKIMPFRYFYHFGGGVWTCTAAGVGKTVAVGSSGAFVPSNNWSSGGIIPFFFLGDPYYDPSQN